MKSQIISALCLTMFLGLGCQKEPTNKTGAHKCIYFVNNSDVNILVSKAPYMPPDSLCYEIMQTYNNPQYTKVASHSTSSTALGLYRYRKDTWENYLSVLSSGTVIVFVHNASISDSICADKNINWNYLNERERDSLYSYLNEQIIIKRYTLTLKDLETLNWTISYP